MRTHFVSMSLAALLLATSAETPNAQESRQVSQGATLFKEHCAKCHGDDGRGGEGYPNPLWGNGGQIRKFRTAHELFEYNQNMMPFDNPAAINDTQKLAIVAFLLANHNVIRKNDVIDNARSKVIKIPE